ncbi:MAG: hypothetical protein JWP81_2824 [Ferruginibacter sp.]|nr:hypothetical protein [Ferruginibacter sp.]
MICILPAQEKSTGFGKNSRYNYIMLASLLNCNNARVATQYLLPLFVV